MDVSRRSLDVSRTNTKAAKEALSRQSLDETRRISFDFVRIERQSGDFSRNKILNLPRALLVRIFTYLNASDLSNTIHVCVQFQIVSKEIVRARYKSLLPQRLEPRMSMMRTKSLRSLKEVTPHNEQNAPEGIDQLRATIKLAVKFFNLTSLDESPKERPPLDPNPFKLDCRSLSCIQTPPFAGSINSISACDPLPVIITSTVKGSLLVYESPEVKSDQMNLIASLETGCEDLKVASGNGRIYGINKYSPLVSVYDVETLKPLSTMGIKTDAKGLLTCIDFDTRTNLLVTGDYWGTINIWDTRSQKHIYEGISSHSLATEDVHIDGNHVVVSNGFLTLYDLNARKILKKEGDVENTYNTCVLSSDKKYYVGGTTQGPINFFSFESGAQGSTQIPFGSAPATSLSLLSDLLLVSDTTGNSFLYDVPYAAYFTWKVKPLRGLVFTPYKPKNFFHPGFITTYSGNTMKTWNYLFEDDCHHTKFDIIHNVAATKSNSCLLQ